MIGFLSGVVKDIIGSKIILDVNGVGYLILLPQNIRATISQPLDLYIHTHVREDAINLFGFLTNKDLKLFETLIEVSGIGPKIAVSILSAYQPEAIINAITQGDLALFTSISGIGKKVAQRLIVELRSKFTSDNSLDLTNIEANNELSLALSGLGYKPTEVGQIYSKIDKTQSLQNQIKQALAILRL